MSKCTSGCSPVKLNLLSRNVHGVRVLDLGAGKLHYSHWITQHFANVSVIAVDLLDQESQSRIEYLKANLEEPLQLESESFSTAVAFDVIEHLDHEFGIISEIMRLLAPGGVLIGSVPHDDDGFLPEYNVTFYHRSDVTHKRYYTETSLTALLSDAGFVDVEVMPEGGVSPHIFAEFFPESFRWPMKKMIGLCTRLGLLSNNRLKSDLFFIAHKK